MSYRAFALALLAAPAFAIDPGNQKRLDAASGMLRDVMDSFDRSIPQRILDRSECIVLVPGLKKGAFIFGAKYGRGFVSCRPESGAGWSAPGAIRVEGGSFGIQIGGSETDVIMLVMNPKGAARLLSSKFTLGADAAAAAGPVGRTAEAETDATLRAEILTWSRSRGLFAGISLQGATLRQDLDVNRDLHGDSIDNRTAVATGRAVPAAARNLIGLLNKYSPRKSS